MFFWTTLCGCVCDDAMDVCALALCVCLSVCLCVCVCCVCEKRCECVCVRLPRMSNTLESSVTNRSVVRSAKLHHYSLVV